MRTGSGFWAAGHDSSHGSSAFSATQLRQLSGRSGLSESACASGEPHAGDDSGDDSDGTEIAAGSSNGSRGAAHGSSSAQTRGQQVGQQPQQQQQSQSQRADDVGAQDAFIAGMIYALSRRMLPGAPYAPGQSGATEALRSEDGRWKLDECLRCVVGGRAGRMTDELMAAIGSRRSLLGVGRADGRGRVWGRRWLELGGLTGRLRWG